MQRHSDPTPAAVSASAVVALGLLGAVWFAATGHGLHAALLCTYALTGVGLFLSERG